MEKKLLFVILPRVPYPLEKGDKLRAYHFIKGLKQYYRIHLFALRHNAIDQRIETEISQICDSYHIVKISRFDIIINAFMFIFYRKPFQVAYFYKKRMKRKILLAVQAEKPSLLFCQLLRTAEYAKDIAIPKLLDFQDAFSKGMIRRASSSSWITRWFFAVEGKRLQRYEKSMAEKFDSTFIISEQDRLAMPEMTKQSVILRNGVDMSYYTPCNKEKKYDLLFVGNMNYAPNVNAVVYFVKNVLPLLMEKIPKIQFVVAGANPHSKVKMLASDNVIVSGWVDDLRDYYSRSKLFVAPMQIGTGLQNKLLEAMAMEVPCITSGLANNALGAIAGKEVYLADAPEDYAAAIIHLLENEEDRLALAKAGREMIERNYSWETQVQILNTVVHQYI